MMEQAMESNTNNKLTKWGVRLIALIFFIRTISGAYKLITYTGPAGSSSGWIIEFNGWNINTDFMGWIELIIPVYIGFQLLRFRPGGRFWALTTLWLTNIVFGGFLIWVSGLVVKAFYYNEPMDISHTNWFGEIRGPIPFLLFFFGVLVIFNLIPTYYLMRKEVKQLFQKPAPIGEANLPPADAKEQST